MCQETCLFKHQQSIVDELKQDLKKITEINDVDVEVCLCYYSLLF